MEERERQRECDVEAKEREKMNDINDDVHVHDNNDDNGSNEVMKSNQTKPNLSYLNLNQLIQTT